VGRVKKENMKKEERGKKGRKQKERTK